MTELIVFDMAGTTVDERNVVYQTVREAINAAGYRFTQEQVQAAGAGKEKSRAIRDVLTLDGQSHSDSEIASIFADFKARLSTAYAELEVREQPGTTALFSRLHDRGINVVLNTGYDRVTAELLVARIGWTIGDEIDGLVTASDVATGRPAPDMIIKAMELVDVSSPAAVIKVGDSQVDVKEGQNASCGMTVGVTTGAQTRAQLELAEPTVIVDSIEELMDYVD